MSGETKQTTESKINILDESSPWDGFSKNYDQRLSREYSLDKLYIMPCLNEMKVFGSFDKENSSTRLQTCEIGDSKGVFVGKKMNRRLSNVCNTTKADVANNNPECTYNKSIEYVPSSVTSSRSCTHKTFWTDVNDFIKKQMNFHNKPLKFFMVSHHHRLLKTILKPLLPKTPENWKIANCMCFHFKSVNGGWKLSIIYDGFPDKLRSNYFRKKNGDNELVLYDSSTRTGMFYENNNKKWVEFTTTYLSKLPLFRDTACEIFLIRHGNAFHNKPLQLVGSNVVSKKLNRNLDTNLTPMGILQARLLGQYLVEKNYLKNDDDNVFCASYLNRAQHTCTELLFALNVVTDESEKNADLRSVRNVFFIRNLHLNDYKKLLSLEKFFSQVALLRIMRKANYNVNEERGIVKRLAKFRMNYIPGGRHGSLDKLYGDDHASCNATQMEAFLLDHFYGLLNWSIGEVNNNTGLEEMSRDEIKTQISDLCIQYNTNLPVLSKGRQVVGTLSGGKKRTKKKRRKKHRHKKTYSRRRKTKRKTRRKTRRRSKKRNRK